MIKSQSTTMKEEEEESNFFLIEKKKKNFFFKKVSSDKGLRLHAAAAAAADSSLKASNVFCRCMLTKVLIQNSNCIKCILVKLHSRPNIRLRQNFILDQILGFF